MVLEKGLWGVFLRFEFFNYKEYTGDYGYETSLNPVDVSYSCV